MRKSWKNMALSTRLLLGGVMLLLAWGSWVAMASFYAWPWSVLWSGLMVIGISCLVCVALALSAALRRQSEQLRSWFLSFKSVADQEPQSAPDVWAELLPLVDAGEELQLMHRELIHEAERYQQSLKSFAHSLAGLGQNWTSVQDLELLLERILLEAKALCHADAATLYLRTEEDTLRFAIVRNDTLGLAYGGSSGRPAPYPPLPLRVGPNHKPGYGKHIASLVAQSGTVSNIPRHDTVSFIAGNYIVNSLLTVPLKGSRGQVLGVLQLLNAQDPLTGMRVAFDEHMERMAESFAALAVTALETWPAVRQADKEAASLSSS